MVSEKAAEARDMRTRKRKQLQSDFVDEGAEVAEVRPAKRAWKQRPNARNEGKQPPAAKLGVAQAWSRRTELELVGLVQSVAGLSAPLAGIVAQYTRPWFTFFIVGGYGQLEKVPPGKRNSKLGHLTDAYGWLEEEKTWVELPRMAAGRGGPGLVIANGRLFTMGESEAPDRTALNTAEMLRVEPAEKVGRTEDREEKEPEGWVQLPSMLSGRHSTHGAVLGGRLYAFQGQQGGEPRAEYLTASGWVTDEGPREHLVREYDLSYRAFDHASSRLYLIATQRTTVWDAVERKWDLTSLPGLPGGVFSNGSAAFLDGRLYAGSYGRLRSLSIGQPELGWRWETPLPEGDRLSDYVLVPFQGHLYLMGGLENYRDWKTDVFRYDPAAKTWKKVKEMALPTGRYAFAAVSRDQEAVLGEETLKLIGASV